MTANPAWGLCLRLRSGSRCSEKQTHTRCQVKLGCQRNSEHAPKTCKPRTLYTVAQRCCEARNLAMDMDCEGACAGSVRDRPAPGGSLLPGISVLNSGVYCDGKMRLRQNSFALFTTRHGKVRAARARRVQWTTGIKLKLLNLSCYSCTFSGTPSLL